MQHANWMLIFCLRMAWLITFFYKFTHSTAYDEFLEELDLSYNPFLKGCAAILKAISVSICATDIKENI